MKFLLLVAVAGLAVLASADTVPGFPGLPDLPKVPGLKVPDIPRIPGYVEVPDLTQDPDLPSLLPKRKRDIKDSLAAIASDPEFISQFASLFQKFAGQMLPQISKRDVSGLLSGAQSLVHLPAGWASDLAAGGKMSMDGIKDKFGKRSILDETHDVQKRDVIMDLLNMLIGNFEGTMTGMDIAG